MISMCRVQCAVCNHNRHVSAAFSMLPVVLQYNLYLVVLQSSLRVAKEGALLAHALQCSTIYSRSIAGEHVLEY